jgi:hypothetical protein
MASDQEQSQICGEGYTQIICEPTWKNYEFNFSIYGFRRYHKYPLETYPDKNNNAMGCHNSNCFFPRACSNNRNR